MKFIHYSKNPRLHLRDSVQTSNGMKPKGLWFSVEGTDSLGWKEWCEVEEFQLENLRCEIEIVFRVDANILFLKTEKEIRDFDKKFGKPAFVNAGRVYPDLTDHRSCDWAAVARKYEGIVIAPYQWRFRLNLLWYYGWDCASGCVWDKDAIEKVRILK